MIKKRWYPAIILLYFSSAFHGRLHREKLSHDERFHQFRSSTWTKVMREREAVKHVGTIFIRIHFCPKNSSKIRRVFGSERLGPKIRGRNKQIRTSVGRLPTILYVHHESSWCLVAGSCRGRCTPP